MSDPSGNRPIGGLARSTAGPRRRRGLRAGYSLVESMTVMVILGILTSIALPRFGRSLEQAKADVAAANLRAVWTAERIYWLENRQYTADLTTFVDRADTPQYHGLLDRSIAYAGEDAPYAYQVTEATATSFSATATRQNSPSWSGAFTITHEGTFTDDSKLSCEGERDIVMGFQ